MSVSPPGSRHSLRTGPGCTILVKLRQMTPMERRRIVVDTAKSDWEPGDVKGHAQLGLYFASPRGERVTMERLGAGVTLPETGCPGGEEIFVLSGELADGHVAYGPGTWIEIPLASGAA